MSMFGDLGVGVSSGKKFQYELMPDDEWVDVYVAADPTAGTRTNMNGDIEPCLNWVVKTVKHKRSDGEPFILFFDTNARFGHEKGHLTQVIKAIFGRMLTGDEFRAIKPGELVGTSFRVMLKHYQGFNKFEQKNETRHAIDRSKGFKTCRVPFQPGVDFVVVPFVRKDRAEDQALPTPPSVSYNDRGSAVVGAYDHYMGKAAKSADEWADLNDPFKGDEDKEVEL